MTIKASRRRLFAVTLVTCLAMPQTLWAQEAIDDSPNEWAMVGDLFVARPIGVVLTVGGTAAWLVSLPFTLLAGHAGEAAETLMIGPAETTFMRCLGCRETGYTYKDVEQIRKARGDDEAEG